MLSQEVSPRCPCCLVCPDCAHHDMWYDEYGSGNEISSQITTADTAPTCNQSATTTIRAIPASRADAWPPASICCVRCVEAKTSE